MPQDKDLFARAGLEATRRDLAGAAWRVYGSLVEEHYEELGSEGKRVYEDVIVYAPFRPPPPKPGGDVFHLGNLPQDEGLKRLYAPLRDTPDLFLRFAGLARRGPLSKDQALTIMLEWVTSYGVLGIEGLLCPPDVPERIAQNRERRESLEAFWVEVRRAARCLALYEAAMAPGGPDVAVMDKWGASGSTPEVKREWALIVASDTVAGHVHADCHPFFYRTVERGVRGGFGFEADKTIGFEQGWGFDSLIGAMYLQMMMYMTGGKEGVKCKRPGCYQLVTFSSPQPSVDPGLKKGARGPYRTRVDKQFCSKACAQWWSDNYGDSKKARRKRERQFRSPDTT